jgi:hypothetical protein
VLVDESLDGPADPYFEGGDHSTPVHVQRDAFQTLTKDARRARFSHPAEDTLTCLQIPGPAEVGKFSVRL